jgi:hypothetical protein
MNPTIDGVIRFRDAELLAGPPTASRPGPLGSAGWPSSTILARNARCAGIKLGVQAIAGRLFGAPPGGCCGVP